VHCVTVGENPVQIGGVPKCSDCCPPQGGGAPRCLQFAPTACD
jgi:hypothetical protein